MQYFADYKNACAKYFGLQGLFTLRQLNEAYKIAALKYHPDKGGNVEDFKEMKQVYDFTKILFERLGLDEDEELDIYDIHAILKRKLGLYYYPIWGTAVMLDNPLTKLTILGLAGYGMVSLVGVYNILGVTAVGAFLLCR
jgi:hypothetical protein